jgi:hypothetical protein
MTLVYNLLNHIQFAMTSANVSEFSLFKLCTEQPRLLDKNLMSLNLTFVKDSAEENEGQREDNSLECR